MSASGGERSMIGAIEVELATLHIGEGSVIGGVMPSIRQLVEADSVLTYSLVDQDEHWSLERWDCAGPALAVRDPLGEMFAKPAEAHRVLRSSSSTGERTRSAHRSHIVGRT